MKTYIIVIIVIYFIINIIIAAYHAGENLTFCENGKEKAKVVGECLLLALLGIPIHNV